MQLRRGNTLPVVKLGFALLRKSRFVAIVNDKLPGYTVRTVETHMAVIKEFRTANLDQGTNVTRQLVGDILLAR